MRRVYFMSGFGVPGSVSRGKPGAVLWGLAVSAEWCSGLVPSAAVITEQLLLGLFSVMHAAFQLLFFPGQRLLVRCVPMGQLWYG